MKNKCIIFDASTLISFSMSCMYDELRKLHEFFGGHFIITQDVKKEVIDKPMRIPRFQYEGIRIQQLVDEGVLEMPNVLGVKDSEIKRVTDEVMRIANSTFTDKRGEIKLISEGEASCIALSKILNEKNISNVVAIDERTMRSFCETPEGLRKHLERKMHTKVHVEKKNFEFFKNFKIIRSVELAYIAYKKGLIKIKNPHAFNSIVNALRYKGCSISNEEIAELKTLK